MDETVENGVGDGGICDHLMPVIDWDLACDDGRSALVPVIDDLKNIATLFAGERSQSPVVEDEEFDPRQRLEQACMASIAACQREGLKQPRHVMVEDGTVITACLVAQRACDPALADAGGAGDE